MKPNTMSAGKLFAGILFSLGSLTALPSHAGINLDIDVAPPAPREEVVPPPREGYVWAPGYYNWNGHQHVWVQGHFIRNKPGRHYVADTWEQRDGHYHHNPGHWER
jgi:hypothetical protein